MYPLQSPYYATKLSQLLDLAGAGRITLDMAGSVLPVVVLGDVRELGTPDVREASAQGIVSAAAGQYATVLLEAPANASLLIRKFTVTSGGPTYLFWRSYTNLQLPGTPLTSSAYKKQDATFGVFAPTATLPRSQANGPNPNGQDWPGVAYFSANTPFQHDFGGFPWTVPPQGQFVLTLGTATNILIASIDFAEISTAV